MSIRQPVDLQQRMMASWVGRPLDARGLLRVLNEDGARPPLFWLFHAAKGPERLARVIGDDQPLVFSRSTNLLAGPEDDLGAIRFSLAGYLAQHLATHYPGQRFDLGSSCQGASMVMQISTLLREHGNDTGSLCLINCPLPEVVTNSPALLVYGDEDALHDPFSRDADDAARRAAACFSTFERCVVSAQHGKFHHHETQTEIWEAFEGFKRVHGPAWKAAGPVPHIMRAIQRSFR